MNRVAREELMDDPSLDPTDYARVLADLAQVNRLTLAARPTLGFLDRAVGGHTRFRLLDVGFGQGDMLRAIARWADRRESRPIWSGSTSTPDQPPPPRHRPRPACRSTIAPATIAMSRGRST